MEGTTLTKTHVYQIKKNYIRYINHTIEEPRQEECLVGDQVHGMFTFKIFILTKAEQVVSRKHLKITTLANFSE